MDNSSSYGVDDISGALAHAGIGIQHAEGARDFPFLVGEHGERKIAQILVLIAPSQARVFGVGGATEQLRIAVGEAFMPLAESGDLGGATKVKSSGQKENTFQNSLPLSRLAVAITANAGNFSPTPIIYLVFSYFCAGADGHAVGRGPIRYQPGWTPQHRKAICRSSGTPAEGAPNVDGAEPNGRIGNQERGSL